MTLKDSITGTYRLCINDLSGLSLLEIEIEPDERVFAFTQDSRYLLTEGEHSPLFKLIYSPNAAENVEYIHSMPLCANQQLSFSNTETEPDWWVSADNRESELTRMITSADGDWVIVTYLSHIDVFYKGVLDRQIYPSSDKIEFNAAFPTFNSSMILVYSKKYFGDIQNTLPNFCTLLCLYDQIGNQICTEPVFKVDFSRSDLYEYSYPLLAVTHCIPFQDSSIFCVIHGETPFCAYSSNHQSYVDTAGKESLLMYYYFRPDGIVVKDKLAEQYFHDHQLSINENNYVRHYPEYKHPRCIKIYNRHLSLLSPSGDEVFSINANAFIHYAEMSPNRLCIGFLAGSKAWTAGINGNIIQTIKHDAIKIYPDDEGEFLSIGRKQEISYFSPNGQLLTNIQSNGDCHECIRQNDKVAFVTRYNGQDTLWVYNIRGENILKWSTRQRISINWVKNKSALIVNFPHSAMSFTV
jgi:hypothetical protein